MLQSLKIQNFKGFRELNFPALKRVNLITGKNSTGKTGVLEAALLFLEPQSCFAILPTAFRSCQNIGNATENYWKWIFRNRDTKTPVIISGGSDTFSELAVTLTYRNLPPGYCLVHAEPGPDGLFLGFTSPNIRRRGVSSGSLPAELGAVPLSVRPTDPQKDALDYDRLVLKPDGEERLEKLLRKLEPRLKSIRSIKPYGAPLLYVDVGLSEKIPAVHFGQGFVRLLSIYSEIIASGKKVLLIDEFENGLHYSALTEIWRGILNATEQEGVQVFATTHSYECIRAAHAAFAETMAYDFALHRLEEVKGEITVTTYDKETLEASLANNFEIR